MTQIHGLQRQVSGATAYWTDPALREAGIAIAFTERTGGVSTGAYSGLNLAAHVGDDPRSVDRNRDIALDAMGIGALRTKLTTAEQVHGERVARIDGGRAGSGAFATTGAGPIASCDALITDTPGVPLMLLFADCVPVVLAVPGRAVGVVHAGWRGALSGIAGRAVDALRDGYGCEPAQVLAYVGAHIGSCHYQVGEDVMSQFVNSFGTFARADSGGLDLGAVVAASLTDSGVDSCNIARLPACTAEATDRFFSYRAEGGTTGRHAALACLLPHSL